MQGAVVQAVPSMAHRLLAVEVTVGAVEAEARAVPVEEVTAEEVTAEEATTVAEATAVVQEAERVGQEARPLPLSMTLREEPATS